MRNVLPVGPAARPGMRSTGLGVSVFARKAMAAMCVAMMGLAGNVSAASPANATSSRTLPTHLYSGSIAGKPITMLLCPGPGDFGAGELSGSYRYGKHKDMLDLKGKGDGQGGLSLSETDARGRVTGVIVGKATGPCIEGSWSAPKGTKTLPFKMCELSKRALLERMAGSYELSSVSGGAGANALVDMERRGGGWRVTGSAIEEGMRQPMEYDLGGGDQDVLDSLRVKVGKDLSVELRAGKTVIRKIPFTADGMDYGLAKDEAGLWYLGVDLGSLSAATTFFGDRLFLSAVEQVDTSALSRSDYFLEKSRLIVSYLPGLDSFAIMVDSLELTFVRSGR